MKSPLRLSNRLSHFRFSLASIGPLRSPVSPLTPTPQSPPLHDFHNQEPLPRYHSTSSTRTSTAPTIISTEYPNEKSSSLAVTVVESSDHDDKPTPTPKKLHTPIIVPVQDPDPAPTSSNSHSNSTETHYYHNPTSSPLTPWHATFHRNAATSTQETRYLTQTTHLRRTRTLLTLLLFLLSTTVTALTSSTLHHYLSTNLPSSFFLPLWPSDMNLTPTLLTLVTSVLTLLFTLPTLTIHTLRGPNPRTTLSNILFTTLTVLTTILALTTLTTSSIQSPLPLFSKFISILTSLVTTTGPKSTTGLSPNGPGSNPHRETIQSFTCALSNTASSFTSDAKNLSLPYPVSSSMVPSSFGRLCMQSQAGYGLVVAMAVTGAVGVAVAMWSWSVERRIEALRGEREVLASREGKGDVLEMPAFVERGDLER